MLHIFSLSYHVVADCGGVRWLIGLFVCYYHTCTATALFYMSHQAACQSTMTVRLLTSTVCPADQLSSKYMIVNVCELCSCFAMYACVSDSFRSHTAVMVCLLMSLLCAVYSCGNSMSVADVRGMSRLQW